MLDHAGPDRGVPHHAPPYPAWTRPNRTWLHIAVPHRTLKFIAPVNRPGLSWTTPNQTTANQTVPCPARPWITVPNRAMPYFCQPEQNRTQTVPYPTPPHPTAPNLKIRMPLLTARGSRIPSPTMPCHEPDRTGPRLTAPRQNRNLP